MGNIYKCTQANDDKEKGRRQGTLLYLATGQQAPRGTEQTPDQVRDLSTFRLIRPHLLHDNFSFLLLSSQDRVGFSSVCRHWMSNYRFLRRWHGRERRWATRHWTGRDGDNDEASDGPTTTPGKIILLAVFFHSRLLSNDFLLFSSYDSNDQSECDDAEHTTIKYGPCTQKEEVLKN